MGASCRPARYGTARWSPSNYRPRSTAASCSNRSKASSPNADTSASCLCCTNRYDKHRPREKQCCSVGKCCKRTPSTRQVQYIHAVLRNALSNAQRDEIITGQTGANPLYILAATLGFRRGEVLGVRWSDLDLNLGTVAPAKTVQRVNGQLLMDDTKTEDSDNTIPLPKITRRVLIEHRNRQVTERANAGELWTEHDLEFPISVGTPTEPRSLNRHFDAIRTRTGYPHVRLHDFRHTVVSLLLQLKTPPQAVQRIARHADLDAMRAALDSIE